MHTLDIFRKKFDYFQSNISEMDELFEASFSSVADSGKFLSRYRWIDYSFSDRILFWFVISASLSYFLIKFVNH